MAKFFTLRTRKRTICALSAALAATFSLAMFTACAKPAEEEPPAEEEQTTETPADNQLLKNGNFEFYAEREEKLEDKRNFISTPTSWTFTSGSPSSDTRSGLIETDEFGYMADEGRTFTSVDDAYAHWNDEGVTLYDRLQFLDKTTKTEAEGGFKETYEALDAESDQKKFFAEYSYTVDFEDVSKLREDFPNGIALHEGVEEDQSAVLMIHNSRNTDGVRGTAQYYTSSTTITLEAGTAAKITGWVYTDHLYHYYSDKDNPSEDIPVENRAGAYIGVINTVGGTTLDEMQVKNINTKGTWVQYTVYVKASSFASTTFRLKLGLGQGTSSDNRYYNVDGYAFFDDFKVEKLRASAYDDVTFAADSECSIDSKKDEKVFDATASDNKVFGLDLYTGTEAPTYLDFSSDNYELGETKERLESDGSDYTSLIPDNSSEGGEKSNVFAMTTYSGLEATAATNGYLQTAFKDDMQSKFPFADNEVFKTNPNMPVLMMLSANKAALTAKLSSDSFTVGKDPLLVSFFVKTSDFRSGKTGLAVKLVPDRGDETTISAFNSHSVATVDIDKDDPALTDIYNGWVQCFFFVNNDEYKDTKTNRTFHLEFTFGPTNVSSAVESDYVQGWAAATDFTVYTLSKTQYSYASTGDRAKKVALSGVSDYVGKFDDAQGSADIENGLAIPASFKGVLAGSKYLVGENGAENGVPDGAIYGLLNSDYSNNYFTSATGSRLSDRLNKVAGESTIVSDSNWNKVFGDAANPAFGTQQPLVYFNGDTASASYGFLASKTTVSANSSRKIGLRVKLSENTKVTVYLIDESDASVRNKVLAPELPKVTYWYDDDGNIVKGDPSSKDFNKKEDILYYLEDNGLYTKKGESGTYYANLHNYKVDEATGNLLSDDDTIVFYCNPIDKKIYAYREENNDGGYTYNTVVENLPTDIARYTAPTDPSKYASKIVVTGTAENKDKWTDVAFYLRTGNKDKTYRLEIWIGDRDVTENGIPAGAYAFFDNYTADGTVSDYDALRDEAVKRLKRSAGLSLDDDLEGALYYTFTFFDSTAYRRYDKTTDDTGVNPWNAYKQSAYEKTLVWLQEDTETSPIAGGGLRSVWLDYTSIDTAVEADTADTNTDSTDTEEEDSDSDVNVWLIVSSSLLAVVLIFAIVAVAVRAIGKKVKRSPKPAKAKKGKKKKAAPAANKAEQPESKPEETPTDDSPYNE